MQRRPPSPSSTFDIERYTGVEPFDFDGAWADPPTVTFVWRVDRCWSPLPPWAIVEGWVDERAPINIKASDPVNAVGSHLDDISRLLQRWKVLALDSELRKQLPDLDFAVAGVAEAGDLPDRITDLRILGTL